MARTRMARTPAFGRTSRPVPAKSPFILTKSTTFGSNYDGSIARTPRTVPRVHFMCKNPPMARTSNFPRSSRRVVLLHDALILIKRLPTSQVYLIAVRPIKAALGSTCQPINADCVAWPHPGKQLKLPRANEAAYEN